MNRSVWGTAGVLLVVGAIALYRLAPMARPTLEPPGGPRAVGTVKVDRGDGAPGAATGARVVTVGGGAIQAGEADREGRFSVPAHGHVSMYASLPDGRGGSYAALTALDAGATPAALVLKPPGLVAGRLVDASGRPVAEAEVAIVGTLLAAKSDAHGGFALSAPEGTWDLLVQSPGHLRQALRNVEVRSGRPLTLIEPVVLADGPVRGGAVDAGVVLTAPPGHRIALFDARLPGGLAVAVANPHGAAAITAVPAGPAIIQLPDGTPRPIMLAKGLTSLALEAPAAAAQVSGTLVDRDGSPIAGAGVRLDPAVGPEATTDARGSYMFEHVPAGDYALVADTREGAIASRTVRVEAADLALDPLKASAPFADVVTTKPRQLDPMGVSVTHAVASQPAASPQPNGDEPPPRFALVPDLAAPTLAAGRTRDGRPVVQWEPVAQDPMPADAAAQYLDVRYDLQVYLPAKQDRPRGPLQARTGGLGHGTWHALMTTADPWIPLYPAVVGRRVRVAAYAWKGAEIVYGPWSYFAVPVRPKR